MRIRVGINNLCIGWISFMLVSCADVSSSVVNTTVAPLEINTIQIAQLAEDKGKNQFSMQFKITSANNTPIDGTKWQLGFFMLMDQGFTRFATAYQNVNPNLSMQICNVSESCVILNQVVAKQVTDNDLSHGATTILAPNKPFTLYPHQQYTIKLLHIGQTIPWNLSTVPQSFFLLYAGRVYNLSTKSSIYSLAGYDQQAINSRITSHLAANWLNSNTKTTNVNIVPSPVSYTQTTGGSYVFANEVSIHNQLNLDNNIAEMFKNTISTDLGVSASVDNDANANTGIILKYAKGDPEQYQININANAVTISATDNAGVFYALQTLRQLWNQNRVLTGATIIDYPRFKYRGILLDTARHYFTVAEIKNFIDIMSAHKLNTLHIHFADDEGFRIELANYPSINSIGDRRAYGAKIGAEMFGQANLDVANINNLGYPPYVRANNIYAGTYSEDDIRDLVKYANEHFISVIPEIDLPGHARALIKSLPEVFVDKNDLSQFVSVQGYNDDVIPVCTYNSSSNFGKKFTITTNDILNQVAKLFSHQTTSYAINNEVSIGGDEVSSGAWTNDLSCQWIWDFNSIPYSPAALQKSQYFFKQLALNNSSLKFSGWQQFIQSESIAIGNHVVPASQVGHVWVWNTAANGIPQAQELAKAGYPTVLTFADQTYFDLNYTSDIRERGWNWAAEFSDTQSALSSALSANKVIASLDNIAASNILGIEGALWSENLNTYNTLIYMAIPKMAGLSEASWSLANNITESEMVNWQSLVSRMGCGESTGFLTYLHRVFKVNYRGYPNGIAQETPLNFCKKN